MTLTHKSVGSDSMFRDSWLEGAAKAFFVTAYADYAEEGYSTDNDLTDDEREARAELSRPGGGGDWYDHAPTTPPNAYALAGELWAMLEAANPGGCGVYTLAERAAKADGVKCENCDGSGHIMFRDSLALAGVPDEQRECGECNGSGVVAIDPEHFGRDLAMQAMGTGVSWFDDHKKFPIKIPHIECNMCSFSDDAYQADE